METAFVLANCNPGKTREVLNKIRELKSVTYAEMVMGPWDIIATVQGSDISYIGIIVAEKIAKIPGVEKTITCTVIKADESKIDSMIY